MSQTESTKNLTFRVKQKNLQESEFSEAGLPTSSDLKSGQILFKIDKFAFTANNITYAVIGDKFAYWQFFPTDADWGIVPVWGFAEVVASNHPGIKTGERYYGYFPTATYLLAEAGEIRKTGFVDISTHRLTLPPVYNFYFHTQQDSSYTPETENIQLIFRPLFTTSFLIDDFIAENNIFDAGNIVLTSASSKTAMALAFLLASRKKQENLTYKIIGLTSAKNNQFVKNLGCYEEVLDYEEIENLRKEATCVVDFAGNYSVLMRLQNHLADHLTYNCLVGMVHWDQRDGNIKEIKGTLFFAPSHIQKRYKDWGADVFQEKLAKAWFEFIQHTEDWVEIEELEGREALQSVYMETLNGTASPKKGYIISLR